MGQGFYSDDFFRRSVASFGPDGYSWRWSAPEDEEIANLYVVELAEGRFAATTGDSVAGAEELFIFVLQDGEWLIDEYYRVVTEYFYGPLG